MTRFLARWQRAYGASPLHLLGLLACFALAGYAAVHAADGPKPVRMAVWFLGAAILHDLVLFPMYGLADRSTRSLLTRLPRRLTLHGRLQGLPGDINYLRAPLLLSALLLLLFFPLIFRRSEDAFGAASGRDQSEYLSHWLLLTAIAFAGSALVFAASLARRAHQSAQPANPERAT